MRKIILMLGVIFLLSACSGEAPFSVSIHDGKSPNFSLEYSDVEITAKTDSLEIQDVIVNKGNCQQGDFETKPPKKLAFGQKSSFRFYKCTAIQVEVKTDQGSWEFDK